MRNDFGTRPYKSRFGGSQAMKKGGSAKKKKQGYKDRKDESIAMRIKKKRTPAQLKASRDESYGKFGSKAKKSGKINRQFMNTRRMNRLEELGRVDAEKADTRKGKRNLREEKSRIVRELKAKGGKVKKKKGKFPDLTGDGKVTRADVLKGRGVFKSGGIAKRGRGCEIR